MQIRDIISHHYFDLDAQEIYYVCDTKLPTVKITIEKMIQDYGLIEVFDDVVGRIDKHKLYSKIF
ncbi:HepT-like ribonuclease domain-containing protein [Sulfurimonas sp.]|uniref:HepT-like ribonuclease domain-containing protein n=1 Tax=Sulfurimonas sp. TaxID=2022749 RepID=UPI0026377C90|nr:HepT-like ribonuclease domain-containing protein [Sulfurimonas sp.]